MNKITRIVIVALLFFGVFAVSPVHAQTENLTNNEVSANTIPAIEELEYTLPYPGILPDHPLYFFKKIRDDIMRLFINNPVKRIEFSLLQSDKYLAMALSYANLGKWESAGKTIIQSQKEMELALTEVGTARKAGITVPRYVVTSLERSTVKHKQRIDEMKTQSHEKPNGVFQKASDAFAQLAALASALREE